MYKKILLSLLISSPYFLYSQHEKNQEDTLNHLQEISIIGLKKSNPLSGSGEAISKETLSKLNQTDVNNVLRTIPGVNIRDEEGFGLRPNIGLRGTPVNRSSKITLMEDGILIAPAPYADPAAYYFPTFARMEGIEVLKGSSQIKHGPYTIGGALNLLSTSIPSSFKALVQTSYGSFGNNQQRIWVGDSQKNFDYLFEVNRIASNGFKVLDGGGNTGFDRRDVMGKIRWHSDKSKKVFQSLSLKFLQSEEKGNETYLGLTYQDYRDNHTRRYAGTQRDILDMNHTHLNLNYLIVPMKGLTISTTTYLSNTFRDWARANNFGGQSINNILNNPVLHENSYGIMTGTQDGTINYRSAARTYFSKGVQSNVNYQFKTKQIVHKMQLGFRFHQDQADRYGTSDTYEMLNGIMVLTDAGVKGNVENQIRNAQSSAIFFNYEFIFKGLTVNPGIRYEDINFEFMNYGNADYARNGKDMKTASNSLTVFLPGVSINYEFLKKMSVFGGVHKGFSPPGMPSTSSTTGQAREEIAINYELGYRFKTGNFNLQTTGFISNYENILGSDNISGGGAGTGDMFNAGKALIQGVEFCASYLFLPSKEKHPNLKFPFRIAYTFTDARFSETFTNGGGDWGTGEISKGDLIPFITPHLLTSNLGLELRKINATFTCRYVGLTRTKPGQETVVTPDYEITMSSVDAIKAYTMVDFSANYSHNKKFTLFTTINNLTNNKSIIANLPQGYRPAMPFAFNLGVKVNL
jgi:Fe(3+) dicitrate transport protein